MERNDFIKEFTGFTAQCREEGVEAPISDLTTLFAIYRKDLTERLGSSYLRASRNGGSNRSHGEKASEKQVQYLRDLTERNSVRISDSDISKMTKEEASRVRGTAGSGLGPSHNRAYVMYSYN